MKEAILEAMFEEVPQVHGHDVRELLPASRGLCLKEFSFIHIDVDVKTADIILRAEPAYPDRDIPKIARFDLVDPDCFTRFHQHLAKMIERAPSLIKAFDCE